MGGWDAARSQDQDGRLFRFHGCWRFQVRSVR